MCPRLITNKFFSQNKRDIKSGFIYLWLFALVTTFWGCENISTPKTESFISEKNSPPPQQEFRWSNGKMPKSFDPARVSAAPESDIVRAIFEGLTDVDSKDLKPIPAIAQKWESSEDFKVWTFTLRKDAKWSNGETVKAEDFVHSWKRVTDLGDKVPHRHLLKNIIGMNTEDVLAIFADSENDSPHKDENTSDKVKVKENNSNTSQTTELKKENTNASQNSNSTVIQKKARKKTKAKFGVEAVNESTLKVTLIHPDQEFPTLVAHPVFFPVYGEGTEFENKELVSEIITNGAFIINSLTKDSLVLERSSKYWDKDNVKLDKIRFFPTENAEQALNAYRNGQIDVVTNANFAPLALKLLKTYNDLRETKHSALTFYEFNLTKKPFSDERVRESLTIAIERERITEDEMDGSTEPAYSYLPFSDDKKITQDTEKAKKLLAEAGFKDGENFPPIKLLITRNDLQKRIAKSIAKMWKKHLNIETEILVKEKSDFENDFQNGDFDIVRRGVVLPTNNETSNMLSMFEKRQVITAPITMPNSSPEKTIENNILSQNTAESPLDFSESEEVNSFPVLEAKTANSLVSEPLILTESEALEKLPAIPLYFPVSYSLIKPYVQGFDVNALDAPSLKTIEIDKSWQPNNDNSNSKNQN